jgi:hypothetical protein
MASQDIIIREDRYFSPGDEKMFFDRLRHLRCIKSVVGKPDGLHVKFLNNPNDTQLRELIALLYRYNLDMTPLAVLKTEQNSAWFAKDKKAFWYTGVFGKSNRTS